VPLNVMVELTWRCGAGCAFCYLGRTGRLNGRGPEMRAAELKAFMRRFPAGTRFYFSGGEPFVRADIFEILSYASKRRLCWGVNTNGLNLGGDRVKRLAALRPAYVIFSLHGPERLHDRLLGVPGAHKKVLAALRAAAALKRPGTELIVNCVIGPHNAGRLHQVYLEAARAGVDRVIFEHMQFLKPGEAAGLSAAEVMTPRLKSCRLDAAALERSIGKIAALKGAFPAHFELRPDFSRKEADRYYNGRVKPEGKCPLLSTYNVEPDGRLRTCVLYCAPAGGTVKDFDEAGLLRAKRRLTRGGLPPGCARCCHRFAIERVF